MAKVIFQIKKEGKTVYQETVDQLQIRKDAITEAIRDLTSLQVNSYELKYLDSENDPIIALIDQDFEVAEMTMEEEFIIFIVQVIDQKEIPELPLKKTAINKDQLSSKEDEQQLLNQEVVNIQKTEQVKQINFEVKEKLIQNTKIDLQKEGSNLLAKQQQINNKEIIALTNQSVITKVEEIKNKSDQNDVNNQVIKQQKIENVEFQIKNDETHSIQNINIQETKNAKNVNEQVDSSKEKQSQSELVDDSDISEYGSNRDSSSISLQSQQENQKQIQTKQIKQPNIGDIKLTSEMLMLFRSVMHEQIKQECFKTELSNIKTLPNIVKQKVCHYCGLNLVIPCYVNPSNNQYICEVCESQIIVDDFLIKINNLQKLKKMYMVKLIEYSNSQMNDLSSINYKSDEAKRQMEVKYLKKIGIEKLKNEIFKTESSTKEYQKCNQIKGLDTVA